MNFLEICKRVRADCAIQGDGPASVLNQTGMLAKVVQWVNDAYVEVQAMPLRFQWMRAPVGLVVVPGSVDYALGASPPWTRPDIRSIEKGRAVLVDEFSHFKHITYWPFEEFDYYSPIVQNTGEPSSFTVTPDGVLRFDSIPRAAYLLRVWARLAPVRMVNDTDVPRMPEEFHVLLVYRATMAYAKHDGDPALYQAAANDYTRQRQLLTLQTVPTITFESVPLI